MKLYYRLLGYRHIKFSMKDSADILNICMKYGYPYREMQTTEDSVSFLCTLHTAEQIRNRAAARDIEVELSEPLGLPSMLYKYKKRLGLWLGLAAAVIIVMKSGRVVWDIRITGNEMLSISEIESTLAACGFSRGSVIDDFNADLTEARAQLVCDNLAWISVNIKGTVAYVEVREKLPVNDSPEPKSPANIVAAQSGRVLEVLAYDGLAMVKAGDEVKAGDLLISGSYGEHSPGLRVTRAAGYVKARTVRSFSVEIMYEYEQKNPTGRKKQEKYIIFFGKPIKVFINSGNLGASCDKIKGEWNFDFFGAKLPISLMTVKEIEYENVKAKYSEAEAAVLAEEKLSRILATELYGADVISKTAVGLAKEESYLLTCEVICVEDIALTREFEYSNAN